MKKITLLFSTLIINLCLYAQTENCAAIVTDKPYYFAGDTIRGHTMVLNSCKKTNHPLEISLASPDGKLLLRQLIPYEESNHFTLPLAGLKGEGFYHLLLSYPKSSDVLLLQQEIAIVQPSSFMEQEIQPVGLQVHYSGKLVHGIEQELLISTFNSQGTGVAAEGQIRVETDTVLMHFKTDNTGLGRVSFTPDSSKNYQIQLTNGADRQILEPVVSQGITVQAQTGVNEVRLNIAGHYQSQQIEIRLKGAHKFKLETVLNHKDSSSLVIKYQQPYSGFVLMQIFGQGEEKLWHQLLYNPIPEYLESATFEDEARSIGATASMSFTANSNEPHSFCSILDDRQIPLLTYSPLQNPLWINPQEDYFEKLLSLWADDSLLLTKIWSAPPLKVPDYGRTLQGTLINEAGFPQKYVPVILSIPFTESPLLYAVTSAEGTFKFHGLLFAGIKTGYLYPMVPDHQAASLRIDLELKQEVSRFTNSRFELFKQRLKPWIKLHGINRKITDLYSQNQDTLAHSDLTNSNQTKSVLEDVDYQVMLDDYVNFNSTRQIIKEVVSGVNFVKRNHIRVFSKELRKNYSGTPLMLVDGIPMMSDSVILRLDPSNIEMIQVVSSRRKLMHIGALGQNGIIAFYTKNGIDVKDMPGVTKIALSGYDRRTSTSTQSLIKDHRSPDLDEVIYWNPQLKTGNGSLRFRIPNNISTYKIYLGAFGETGLMRSSKSMEIY